jgi:surfeit locus 1 family protein
VIIINLFKRRWILTSLLALLAVAVLVRLGFWQLDRLHQRRETNAKVIFQMYQPALNLSGQALDDPLTAMQYRKANVEERI